MIKSSLLFRINIFALQSLYFINYDFTISNPFLLAFILQPPEDCFQLPLFQCKTEGYLSTFSQYFVGQPFQHSYLSNRSIRQQTDFILYPDNQNVFVILVQDFIFQESSWSSNLQVCLTTDQSICKSPQFRDLSEALPLKSSHLMPLSYHIKYRILGFVFLRSSKFKILNYFLTRQLLILIQKYWQIYITFNFHIFFVKQNIKRVFVRVNNRKQETKNINSNNITNEKFERRKINNKRNFVLSHFTIIHCNTNMSLRPYLNSSKSRNQQIKSSYQKRSNPTPSKETPLNKDRERITQIMAETKPKQTCENSFKVNLLNKDFMAKQKGPLITATHFLLYDQYNDTYVGQREMQQKQIASLTKIMTTILALELIQKYKLNKELLIKISKNCTTLNGTSAKLVEGCFIQLYDLLYATMLPSGNDAAYLLAEVFGLLLFYENIKPQQKQYNDIQSIDLSFYENTITFVNKYIKQMNRRAKQLKMTKTNFANPHGLANVLNLSTAKDMMILSQHAVQNSDFRKIMSTKQFSSQLYEANMQEVFTVRQWRNTNKLIDQGWEGIKTGHTASAGCCLASLKNGIYIVLLNSSSTQKRFEDTVEIYRWYQTKGILSAKNLRQSSEQYSSKQLQTQ